VARPEVYCSSEDGINEDGINDADQRSAFDTSVVALWRHTTQADVQRVLAVDLNYEYLFICDLNTWDHQTRDLRLQKMRVVWLRFALAHEIYALSDCSLGAARLLAFRCRL
jgi:hypothetical protein